MNICFFFVRNYILSTKAEPKCASFTFTVHSFEKCLHVLYVKRISEDVKLDLSYYNHRIVRWIFFGIVTKVGCNQVRGILPDRYIAVVTFEPVSSFSEINWKISAYKLSGPVALSL